ncbi:uncharacterized protein LOC119550583 [Drosophila subpulchrella]|uniref:uncharacterized protein LOC119550583 n=1 Tax=Drosophila subpulchrella TaxID=1486046 RepID=UPI0018A15344|nr:uncharacterized protein LOC119550583 [Drosophila subpulchrella]
MAHHKSLSVKLKLPNRVQPEFIPQPGREGQYTNKMHFLKRHLLDEVSKKKFALDFLEPVDTEALKVPTYYTVIDRPMDLGTILKRVQNNYYKSVDGVIADFRLIIRNCFKFNQPGDVVFRKGQMLEKFFMKKVKAIPQGPEMPCNKDPLAGGRSRGNTKMLANTAQTERMCRDQLKKLQHFTNQADATARNFFTGKWDSLLKKLDKHYFKSFGEFRSHVDGIFQKYHDPAKAIFEKAFLKPEPWTAAMISGPNMLGSAVLADADLNELLQAAKLAEDALGQSLQMQGSWEGSRTRNVVEALCASVSKVKLKLEASRPNPLEESSGNQQGLSPSQKDELVPRELKPARDLLNSSEVDTFMAVSFESSDEECNEAPTELDYETAVTTIQKLFAKLPSSEMREIIHLIQQIEGISDEGAADFGLDMSGFAPGTLYLVKQIVAKAVRVNSKLNLKDMPSSEKDCLERSLQNQLVDITRVLNKNRRRNSSSLLNLRAKQNYNVVRKGSSCSLAAKMKTPPGKLGARNPGAGKPAAGKPGAGKPGAGKPGAGKPGGGKFGMGNGVGVGESRNLSDTSDDSAPPSPQRNIQKRRTPPPNMSFGSSMSLVSNDLRMSSSNISQQGSVLSSSSSPSSNSGSGSSSGSGSGSSSSSSSDSSESEDEGHAVTRRVSALF